MDAVQNKREALVKLVLKHWNNVTVADVTQIAGTLYEYIVDGTIAQDDPPKEDITPNKGMLGKIF